MAVGAAPTPPPVPEHESRYPLALTYACLAFLLGIYLATTGLPVWALLAILPAALLAARRGGWPLALLVVGCGAALALGAWRYDATAYHNGPDQIAYYVHRSVDLTGVVDGELQAGGHGENLPFAVETAKVDGRAVVAGGRILVHYTGSQAIEYGDRLELQGRLLLPSNPPGFDYRAYLAGQGIHATMDFPILHLLAHGAGNPLQGLALGLRAALRHAINEMLPQQEAALLIGILLGAPTRSLGALTALFVRVGMIHIVAISGLKVALVAGIISTLCARLPMRVRWAPAMTGVLAYTLVCAHQITTVGRDGATGRRGIHAG